MQSYAKPGEILFGPCPICWVRVPGLFCTPRAHVLDDHHLRSSRDSVINLSPYPLAG